GQGLQSIALCSQWLNLENTLHPLKFLAMIRAEKAQRIMQRYEDDYDNFLDKLKAKRKAKKEAAAKAKAESDKADKNVSEAEAHKKTHLGQKAKDLLDKMGGISGATESIKNVMGYFKDNTPSDYDINVGGSGEDDAKQEKKIMGMPPMVAYGVGAVVVLAGLYGLSRLMKKNNAQPQVQQPIQAPVAAPVAAEPVLQAA
ncbi:MAG TPA: hypothetical protein VLB84_06040, partial [Bacteroidia bacterium]|nr:hypothetical protein [Bacteroidia bacterium]